MQKGQYKTFKTTMGHKIRMRMTEDEIAERELFHIALVGLPFITAALMFALWIKMG